MKYERFNSIMEELVITHKYIQKLALQHCHHLTMEQGKLLFLIHKEKMNQKQIAQKLHISEATLSVRIKRLVDIGLVERKMNNEDKRNYKIVLSSRGETAFENMRKDFDYMHSVICKGMNDADYQAVLQVIEKIKRNVKEELE